MLRYQSIHEEGRLGSSAVRSEAESDWIFMLRKTHPSSHGIDDIFVSVNSRVSVFLPVSSVTTVITARVGIESFLVWY